MYFRTLLHMLLSRRAPTLDVHDVARLDLRVLPVDVDLIGHMNNGVYLSIMDLGRFDLLIRAGVWQKFREVGYYPVVSSETITFRKSLQPWQRYVLETRIAGYDGKAVFVQQRFTVDGEIYAEGLIRGRFLKKGGGVVSIAELSEVAGIDVSDFATPEWMARWSDDVALPPSRAEAPSDWSA